MKFSSIAAIGALMGLSAANHVQTTNIEADIVCTDAPPSTVTTTVTVTAPPITTTGSSWVKTVGGSVTSCDYSGSQTTVYVWPTGSASQDITVVIYEGLTVINVTIIDLDVVVIDGQTSTVTVTKTNQPTYTPPPPPPPPQSTTSQTTSTKTSTAAKQTHTVQVGALGELIYGPNQLNATLGDIIRFDFLKLNHSVTQSSFAKPCTYNGGFDTGLNQFNPQNISGKFLVDFQVNTTDPLWFYW
jgi:plastocyanin